MAYEEARLNQVLLNNNDEQSEVQMILTAQQLRDSRYAISQATNGGQFTNMAFIFVPLATVCYAFSMNVKEVDTHHPLWLFILVAITCATAAVIVLSESMRRAYQEKVLRFGNSLTFARSEKDDIVEI